MAKMYVGQRKRGPKGSLEVRTAVGPVRKLALVEGEVTADGRHVQTGRVKWRLS